MSQTSTKVNIPLAVNRMRKVAPLDILEVFIVKASAVSEVKAPTVKISRGSPCKVNRHSFTVKVMIALRRGIIAFCVVGVEIAGVIPGIPALRLIFGGQQVVRDFAIRIRWFP